MDQKPGEIAGIVVAVWRLVYHHGWKYPLCKAILRILILSKWWDMLVFWRVILLSKSWSKIFFEHSWSK